MSIFKQRNSDITDFMYVVSWSAKNKHPIVKYTIILVFERYRYIVLAITSFIFLYYHFILESSFISNAHLFPQIIFLVTLNLSYLIILTIPRLYISPWFRLIRFRTIRLLLDLLFVSFYFYFELILTNTNSSMIIFTYIFPLLLAGYYYSLFRSLIYVIMANLLLVITIRFCNAELLTTHSFVAIIINCGCPFVLHITARYTGSYLKALEAYKTKIFEVASKYAVDKITDDEFFECLGDYLRSMFNADNLSFVLKVHNSSSYLNIMGDVKEKIIDTSNNIRYGIHMALNSDRLIFERNPFTQDKNIYSIHDKACDNFLCVAFPLPGKLYILEITRPAHMPFQLHEVRMIKSISDLLSELFEAREEIQVIKFINKIQPMLTRSNTVDELTQKLFDTISILTGVHHCSFWEYKQPGELHLKIYLGLARELGDELPLLGRDSYSQKVLLDNRKPSLLINYQEVESFKAKDLVEKYHPELKSILIVPISLGETRIGVMHFWAPFPHQLKPIEKMFPFLTYQLAPTIKNLQYLEPYIRKTVDAWRGYFEEYPFVKTKEHVSLYLKTVKEDSGCRNAVEISYSNEYNLKNVSENDRDAKIYLRLHSPLELESVQHMNQPIIIRSLNIERRNGEIERLADNVEELYSPKEKSYIFTCKISSRDTVKISCEITFYLPSSGSDSFLTQCLSFAPKYSVKWDEKLNCSIELYTRDYKTIDILKGINSKIIIYPQKSVILPFQGIFVRWAPR